MPPDTVPTPVIVVAGAARPSKRRLVAELLAGRPVDARWAVLDNGSVAAGEVDHVVPAGARVGRFPVPGGCACCIAGPAFRAALVRLLRAGPWDCVLVDVDPAGHADAIVDQLRSPPFDRLLRVGRLLVPLAASQRLWEPDGGTRGADRHLGFASDLLLLDDADGTALAAAGAALERAGPWPRRRVTDANRRLSTPQRRMAGANGRIRHTDTAEPALPGLAPAWRVFSAMPPASLVGERLLVRRWPGEAVAGRRPVLDHLQTFVSTPEIAGFVALVRTARAWYRWAWGRIDGPGALAIDQPALSQDETSWRLDSRLVLSLAARADRDRVAAPLEALAREFDRA